MEAELKKKYDIAYDFSSKAYKKFQSVVKSIVLFGSTAKDTASEKSDIDIIIIVDNCSIKWDEELTAWYRQELRELIAKQHYGKKLHVNTVTLSAFYDQIFLE